MSYGTKDAEIFSNFTYKTEAKTVSNCTAYAENSLPWGKAVGA